MIGDFHLDMKLRLDHKCANKQSDQSNRSMKNGNAMFNFDEDDQKLIEKAKRYWTDTQLAKITNNKNYLITPRNAPILLRRLSLLNADASMSVDSIRKFKQVNHLLQLIEPIVFNLHQQLGDKAIQVIDCGCGNSYLTFLMAWAGENIWHIPMKIIGIDHRMDLITKCLEKAQRLGLSTLSFEATDIETFKKNRALLSVEDRKKQRFHLVVALHACDTATDDALGLALDEQSDAFAVAPCCQAELARKWKALQATDQALGLLQAMMKGAELRREGGALFTDLARVLLLRSSGYEVNTTEFVSAEHSPKNRLITGMKRGRYLKTAIEEYAVLRQSLHCGIKLEALLTKEVHEQILALLPMI